MEIFQSSYGAVELTEEREKHIFRFHPEVRPHQKHFKEILSKPNTIRRSKFDVKAIIFYRSVSRGKYLAVVVKTNQRNFILTAYVTNEIQHQPL